MGVMVKRTREGKNAIRKALGLPPLPEPTEDRKERDE